MRVHWLIPGDYTDVRQLTQSSMASIRMRSGLACQYALTEGYSVSFGDHVTSSVDILVVGKIGGGSQNGRAAHWTNIIQLNSKKGAQIILDYTDHYLEDENSPMGNFYSSIISYVNVIVTPSLYMSSLLASYWPREIVFIPDPVEVHVSAVKDILKSKQLEVLWFGHSSNIGYLVEFLTTGLTENDKFGLVIVSNGQTQAYLEEIKINTLTNLDIKFVHWSLDNLIKSASYCEACIIPSNTNYSRKMGASSNRLITSFALGLPTAADALPSYQPYEDYFFNLRNSSFSHFLTNLHHYSDKVRQAQEVIIQSYASERIGAKWMGLFYKLFSS